MNNTTKVTFCKPGTWRLTDWEGLGLENPEKMVEGYQARLETDASARQLQLEKEASFVAVHRRGFLVGFSFCEAEELKDMGYEELFKKVRCGENSFVLESFSSGLLTSV